MSPVSRVRMMSVRRFDRVPRFLLAWNSRDGCLALFRAIDTWTARINYNYSNNYNNNYNNDYNNKYNINYNGDED